MKTNNLLQRPGVEQQGENPVLKSCRNGLGNNKQSPWVQDYSSCLLEEEAFKSCSG